MTDQPKHPQMKFGKKNENFKMHYTGTNHSKADTIRQRERRKSVSIAASDPSGFFKFQTQKNKKEESKKSLEQVKEIEEISQQ